MRVDPFFSPHVAAFRHPLVFGKMGKQWGVYCRHKRSRGEIEWGVIFNGSAAGLLLDYDSMRNREHGPKQAASPEDV